MSDIRFERVTCRYPGSTRPAIAELDLTVHDGELLALHGRPGAGKSTLLRMLAQLVPVTSGHVSVGARELDDPANAPMVLVFQNYSLQPSLTVMENIALPLVQQSLHRRVLAERVETAAAHVELRQDLRRRGSVLTSGERIRVALARAIVRDPGALLLDEPLANLQPGLREEVTQLLVTAQRSLSVTTLYATSDAEEARTVGERVAVLDDGVLQGAVGAHR